MTNLKKMLFIIGFLFVITLAEAIIFFIKYHHAPGTKPEPVSAQTSLVLFYSSQCPHCVNVKAYLEKHPLAKSASLTEKNLSLRDNVKMLWKAVEQCHLPRASVGIPLLWDGDKTCYIGEDEVIQFLTQSAPHA